MASKIILIFLISILAGLILFLGGYLLSSKDQTANLGNLSRFDQPNTRSESAGPQLRRLSTVRAVHPAITEDGRQVLFFEAGHGKIRTSDFLGEERTIIYDRPLDNLVAAYWAPNGYEAIIAQSSRGAIIHFYFNLKTKQLQSLHPNLSHPVWSTRNDKIAYLWFDRQTNEGQISISNPDGSVFKNILPTRADQLAMTWPQQKFLSFYNQTSENQDLFVLNMEEKKLDKIFGPVADLRVLWAPDFSKVFLTYREEGGRQSALINMADKTVLPIELITAATKCVWSINATLLYCGAQQTAGELESLYVWDTKTQSAQRLFSPRETETIDVRAPLLSPAEDFLIFVNQDDQYLYSISL